MFVKEQKQFSSTIVYDLSIVENKATTFLATDWALYDRCERICALESLAHDLVVYGLPKQASCIASSIPKIYEVRVELYSKELEADDRGYAVPKKVIFVNVQTLSPTESAVRSALKSYLDEYEIGGYTQPEAEINEELMF